MKKSLFVLLGTLMQISLAGQTTGSWGDQSNGTFINPVLNSDYSDPDVIRVDKKYYMVCSEFHFMGIPVLESDDMVNWKIIGKVYENLSPDGKQLLDDGVTVYTGPVAEGTKIHKLNGYYYLSIPEGGVERGWQTILRSKTIFGPYEKKVILEKGSTSINGPHQGSLVDTPDSEWWFYHFQSDGAMGRVVHLQPVRWQDGWPEIGVDIDRNGIGEPVYVWKKPDIKGDFKITAPQSDDDFNSSSLGLQWQWNHNPVNNFWSLTEKPGMLILKALKAENFNKARNTLTQKVMGTTGKVVTEMDITGFTDGQKAGICSMGGRNTSLLGVVRKGGQLYVFTEKDGKITGEKLIKSKKVYLKVILDIKGDKNQFFYSLDNKQFNQFGESFTTSAGFWKGTRIGLFSFNETNESGSAAFNWFTYNYDGPKGIK
jgi:beta-xylosidase